MAEKPYIESKDATPATRTWIELLLTKLLAWPVFAVVFLISFWPQLHHIADTIPQLLSGTEEVTIGKTTLRLHKSLIYNMPPEVKKIFENLDAEDIRFIFDNPPDNILCSNQPIPSAEKLIKAGLLRKLSKDEMKQEESHGYPCDYGVRPTSQYASIRKLLIDAVVEVIQPPKAVPRVKGPHDIKG